MKHLRNLVLCASAAVLAACATATPYQPASSPGGFDGFSQTMLTADQARISFGGNSLTKRDTVEDYLLFRAAETALEQGYDWFELQETDLDEKTRRQITPGFGPSYGYGPYGRGVYGSRFDPYFGYTFYRPGFGWSRPYRYSRFGGFNRYRGFGRSRFYDPFYDPFFDDGYDVREITRYRATAEVKFGRGTPPATADRAFDARQIIETIGPRIRLPEG